MAPPLSVSQRLAGVRGNSPPAMPSFPPRSVPTSRVGGHLGCDTSRRNTQFGQQQFMNTDGPAKALLAERKIRATSWCLSHGQGVSE